MMEHVLLSVLVRFARTLTAEFTSHDVLDGLMAEVGQVLPVDGGGVLLMDSAVGHHFTSTSDEAIRRIEGLQVELGEGPCLAAYETDAGVAIPDVGVDARFPAFSAAAREAGLAAIYSFPLRHAGGRFGALELYTREPTELTPAQRDAAQTIADIAASYLIMARARERSEAANALLAQAALHDPLTGLPNRQLLHDRLTTAEDRSRREQQPFAVIFLDVDDFKAVNDTWGHEVGDQVLVALVDRLRKGLRAADTLARVSGDEFVIVCEQIAGWWEVEAIADKVIAAATEPLPVGSALGTPIAVSAGVAWAGGTPGAGLEALRRADAAMYIAKRRGGNQHAVDGTSGAQPAPSATRSVGEGVGEASDSEATDRSGRGEELHPVVAALESIPSGSVGTLTQRLCAGAARRTGTDSAGITVDAGHGDLDSISASRGAEPIETLQVDLGEGPAYTAHRHGAPVHAPDLRADERWPAFSTEATARGCQAAFAFPLLWGSAELGVLTLYRAAPGDLDPEQQEAALLFARLVLNLLLAVQTGRPAEQLDELFGEDVADAASVHQAAGMVSGQLAISVAAALAVLRAHAYAESGDLRALAEDVIARRYRFDRAA